MRECDLREQIVSFLKVAGLFVFEELLELTRARARRLSSSGGNTDGDGSMFSGDGSARKVHVNRSLGVRCSGNVGGSYAVGSRYSGGGAN